MDLSEHVCTWRCVMMQERKQKGKILVFSSREICYLSSNFFANQIGAAFEELGYEVRFAMSKNLFIRKLQVQVGHLHGRT